MTDKVVILVTAGKLAEAKRIAKHLIEAKLAACVNITQPVQSLYRWEGRIAHDQEVLMIIKSTRELFPEVKAAVCKLHSYKTPEVICLPIVDGSEEYLAWIGASVKSPETPGC
ncbi:MAG TPA: divalent-cation tolerance protein CutA [Terriglobia bacterium]|nr:divalent-cation tolerance protein CutA [Terriglobia bacterium]